MFTLFSWPFLNLVSNLKLFSGFAQGLSCTVPRLRIVLRWATVEFLAQRQQRPTSCYGKTQLSIDLSQAVDLLPRTVIKLCMITLASSRFLFVFHVCPHPAPSPAWVETCIIFVFYRACFPAARRQSRSQAWQQRKANGRYIGGKASSHR